MAKSKKRTHEEMSSDSETNRQIKILKVNSDVQSWKKIKRKEQSHSISSSDSEVSSSAASSIKHNENVNDHTISPSENEVTPSKRSSNKSKYTTDNRSIHNGNVSSSRNNSFKKLQENILDNKPQTIAIVDTSMHKEIDSEEDNIVSDENSNTEFSDHVESSQYKTNTSQVDKSQSIIYTDSSPNEKLYHKRRFTEEDEEEISKFSPLVKEDLLKNNHIWLLQCPTNMNASRLVNQFLDLSGKCQLEEGGVTYEAYSHKNDSKIYGTLAVPYRHNRLQLRRIPVMGNIIVEESVIIGNNRKFEMSEPLQRVELPDNLRIRHPLLGIDYAKQPKTKILERVKKRKHSKKKTSDVLDEPEPKLNSTAETLKKKKKKKHSNTEDLDYCGKQEQHVEEESSKDMKLKSKKKKHERQYL